MEGSQGTSTQERLKKKDDSRPARGSQGCECGNERLADQQMQWRCFADLAYGCVWSGLVWPGWDWSGAYIYQLERGLVLRGKAGRTKLRGQALSSVAESMSPALNWLPPPLKAERHGVWCTRPAPEVH